MELESDILHREAYPHLGPDPKKFCRANHGGILADGTCTVCGKPWKSPQDGRLRDLHSRPVPMEPPRFGSDYDTAWNPDAGGHAETWENR